MMYPITKTIAKTIAEMQKAQGIGYLEIEDTHRQIDLRSHPKVQTF